MYRLPDVILCTVQFLFQIRLRLRDHKRKIYPTSSLYAIPYTCFNFDKTIISNCLAFFYFIMAKSIKKTVRNLKTLFGINSIREATY